MRCQGVTNIKSERMPQERKVLKNEKLQIFNDEVCEENEQGEQPFRTQALVIWLTL